MLLRLILCLTVLCLAGCQGDDAPSDGPGTPTATPGKPADGDNALLTASPGGPRPNIVFILVDTLRADRLGVYGGPSTLTPEMDSLAKEGSLFERGIAPAPWTLPSVASLFSGVSPTIHQANDYEIALKDKNPTDVSVRVLSDNITTLAERLGVNGYDTGGFVANIFLKPKFGLHQGFAHYDHSFVANSTPGSTVNRSALAWLRDRDRSKPFFAYLHYMDVHAPYTAERRFVDPLVQEVAKRDDNTVLARDEMNRHPGYFGKSAKPFMQDKMHSDLFQTREYWWARYDAGVRQVDHFIGSLRNELKKIEAWDNTLVIITADHGEALGEHGIWTHGLSPHQDQLHVPMIIRWPGNIPGGLRVKQSVRMFDLFPTILDYLELPREDSMQAASLRPLLERKETRSRYALGEAVKHAPNQVALVHGAWKLMGDVTTGTFELYNLDEDPNEKTNVAGAHPDVVKELTAKLKALRAENEARMGEFAGSRRNVDEAEMKRLQQLGYVGDDEDDDDE